MQRNETYLIEYAGVDDVPLFVFQLVKGTTIYDGQKISIVYLSRTNNTKAIASIIQNNVGGDVVAIELEKPYPIDYKAILEQVSKENETVICRR